MARLIFASGLDRQAKRYAWLRELLFRFEAAIVYLLWWTLRALSPERAARLGAAIVGAVGPRSAKARLVRDNLRIAFPTLEETAIDSLARGAWRSIGRVAGEYPHLDRIARDPGRLEIDDRCGLGAYVRRERQAVFFGAHLSNWEIMALALAREGVPLLALHAPLTNPYLGRLMDRARTQLGCRMLARGESMRALITQLRDGGSIGLLLDLAMKDGVPVPFFGHPMMTSVTPARLALRYGCDLVPIRTVRVGNARFHVTIDPPVSLDVEGPEGIDEGARVVAITRRLNALMESWIRDQPDEWMCANRRWDKALHRALRR